MFRSCFSRFELARLQSPFISLHDCVLAARSYRDRQSTAAATMVVHNMYVFGRDGACLYYNEWLRPKPVRDGAGSTLDDQKMMFGLFWSLKTFAAAMDPKSKSESQLGAPLRIGEACSFYSFRANNYKLHFFETLSGLKFVLNTDETVGDLREHMHYIYSSIFVEYVTKNPVYEPGRPFNFEYFTGALNKYIRLVGL